MDVKIRFIVCFKSDPPNKKGGAPRGDPPQTVDKVPAKAGLFYIYNRFSGIMELSERRCFL